MHLVVLTILAPFSSKEDVTIHTCQVMEFSCFIKHVDCNSKNFLFVSESLPALELNVLITLKAIVF